jgi:E3 ubiquitin-protein ligase BIG BROTHER and related proteins
MMKHIGSTTQGRRRVASSQRITDVLHKENSEPPLVFASPPRQSIDELSAILDAVITLKVEPFRAVSHDETNEHLEIGDMDNDTLSYEACLEIGEALGSVMQDEWMARAEDEINRLDIEIFCQTTSQCADDELACLVCMEDFGENDVQMRLPCKHILHVGCAEQWLIQNNACPCCRKPITEDR